MKTDNTPTLKVLIVDDNPDDRYLCNRLLKDAKDIQWSVLESETGKDGIELCKTEQPDCILLDYILPDIDGLEFLSQLKSMQLNPAVIMLTGQGDETVAVLAMKDGAQDYLVKDRLTPATLKSAILKCCNKNSAGTGHLGKRERSGDQPDQKKMLDEIKNLKEKLQSSPGIDAATGLPNRANMMEKLQYEKLRFERNKKPFSVIMADIDDFQRTQETYSPQTIDQLLTLVGKMLDENSRKQDLICRWAEKRFVLLLPETDLNGATVLLEKFCRIVETKNFVLPGQKIQLSMSFQAGVYDDPTLEIEYCIQQADECVL